MADVVGYEETPEGGIKAIPGKLYYRGYDVEDLVKGKQDSHFGYEEICFLLLFGYLPKKAELEHFRNILTDCYEIPDEFVVGYGLDYAQKYRNLPFIGVVELENQD